MAELLPSLKPIPIKERLPVLYIEKGHLDVLDGAFVILDKIGEVGVRRVPRAPGSPVGIRVTGALDCREPDAERGDDPARWGDSDGAEVGLMGTVMDLELLSVVPIA